MRILVNLATRPFVELQPFFLRLRIIMGALAVVAIGLLIGTHILQKSLKTATAQMDALVAQTQRAQQEKSNNERRMRQPENAGVLERAHFLNALFLRKSFSWTAVMMDLETVLPTGVQVTAIEPQIAADGDVIIRLRVSGDRDRAIQLVRNLERSKRFLNPELSTESPQTKGAQNQQQQPANAPPPGVEFEILARYNPLPEGESYTADKSMVGKGAAAKAAAPKAAGAAPKRAAPKPAAPKPVLPPARPGAAPGKYPPGGVVLKPFAPSAPRGATR
jgi:type IV pilus assembly protein PilN